MRERVFRLRRAFRRVIAPASLPVTFRSRSVPDRPAVLLLSGGLDSTTLLALASAEGYAIHALTFRYGQRHAHEVAAARRVAQRFAVRQHVVADIDLRMFGGSALTTDVPVPKDRSPSDLGSGVPITYVPARNTIFLSFALAWAEVLGAREIFIGVNALDYSGYPDCRPEYIRAYERMANLATRAAVEGHVAMAIRTPLMELTKREIIQLGQRLGVDYALTTSCYDPTPDGAACGRCDACQLRLRGFHEAGTSDPARYSAADEESVGQPAR
jgi:7-cyano-7-deazaguanine synthase